MNFETICMGCMTQKGEQAQCPQCDFDEKRPVGPLALPLRTLLNSQFVVGRVLGKPGGFGVTYLGWDTTLETRVAIKEFLPRELAARESDRMTVIPYSEEDGQSFDFGLTQFLQEARTLAKFDHANVVRVKAFFEGNNTAYLVMDYYDGIPLDQYLKDKGGRISEKLAKDIMMPILDGLREVHEKGFLHRDIKPQNVYLTQNGRPMLLDFGAARFAMGERSRSLSVVLTPGYAPYEQYHRKGKQGPWTDIYACGATLYRMIIGEAPPEATERVSEDELQPPVDILPEISRSFSEALMWALNLKGEDRPQSIFDFQQMLLGEIADSSDSEDFEKSDDESDKPNESNEPATDKKDGTSEIFTPDEETSEQIIPDNIVQNSKKIKIESKSPPRESKSNRLYLMTIVGIFIFAALLAWFSKLTTTATEKLSHGDYLTNDYGMEFVYIEPGTFQMGSPPNEPQRNSDETLHSVSLTKGFYMQTTEVTQGQWEAIMGSNPSLFKDCGSDCPVEQVSWNDIQKYIEKLNQKKSEEKGRYRLPTETEWEYAARAGTETAFSFGRCLSTDQANYDGDHPLTGCSKGEDRQKTVAIRSFAPNAWGLYDMHGNVYEWCQDWYGDYPSRSVTDPEGASSGSMRVLRGGGWFGNAWACRSASRSGLSPVLRIGSFGFRLVLSPRSTGR